MLPLDILYTIIEFLPLDGVFVFNRVCVDFHDLVQEHKKKGIMTGRIEALLKKFIPDFSAFKLALLESRAVVTGGVIITAMLPDIEFDDIDLMQGYGRMFGNEIDTGSATEKVLTKMSGTPGIWTDKYAHNINSQIYGSKNYQINSKTFQVTFVEGSPVDSILKSFDFNVAQNYYDGKRLYIHATDALAERRITIRNTRPHIRERFRYRMLKYQLKGFEFNSYLGLTDNLNYSFKGKEEPSHVVREREIFRLLGDELEQIMYEKKEHIKAEIIPLLLGDF